jgi:hypothetical protein
LKNDSETLDYITDDLTSYAKFNYGGVAVEVWKLYGDNFKLIIKNSESVLDPDELPGTIRDDRTIYKFEKSVFPKLGTFFASEPYVKRQHFFLHFNSGDIFDVETTNKIIHCINRSTWQRQHSSAVECEG